METRHQLDAQLYLSAFASYGIGITGGVLSDFLRGSVVKYYGGKCPVYLICYYHNGTRVVVGGNYATNGKPQLRQLEEIDFD